MPRKIIISCVILLFIGISCKKENDNLQEKMLLGTWQGSLIGTFIDPIAQTYTFNSNNKYSISNQNNLELVPNLKWKIKNKKLYLQEEKNNKQTCYIITKLTNTEFSFRYEASKNGEAYLFNKKQL